MTIFHRWLWYQKMHVGGYGGTIATLKHSVFHATVNREYFMSKIFRVINFHLNNFWTDDPVPQYH